LSVSEDGTMFRSERTYAVASGWATVLACVKFTHFEVWQVAF
jgi:hypothetical protein